MIDMAFNMGEPRLRGFKKMIAALHAGDFDRAALEALDSKWAREDVAPERSGEIAAMLRTGRYRK